MKTLGNALKQALSALAHQDAGEFLSRSEKRHALGLPAKRVSNPVSTASHIVRKQVAKRIALITDGRGSGAPLNYVIESCLRQGAAIDLLIHGAVDTDQLFALELQIQQAGVEFQRIRLGTDPITNIVEFICNHPALIFLVGISDDATVAQLIEDAIPSRGGRLPVPLVLIEDTATHRPASQSAA